MQYRTESELLNAASDAILGVVARNGAIAQDEFEERIEELRVQASEWLEGDETKESRDRLLGAIMELAQDRLLDIDKTLARRHRAYSLEWRKHWNKASAIEVELRKMLHEENARLAEAGDIDGVSISSIMTMVRRHGDSSFSRGMLVGRTPSEVVNYKR